MQTVYLIISDSGDGSGCIDAYRNTSEEVLLERMEKDCEVYWMNEGSIARTLTLPDSVNLNTIGLRFVD